MGKARNFAKLGAMIQSDGKIALTSLAGSSAASIGLAAWSIQEISGVLYFTHNNVKKAKLDSAGNLTVIANATAYGTV